MSLQISESINTQPPLPLDTHLTYLCEPTIHQANERGDRSITCFLHRNTWNPQYKPITCTLYPKTDSQGVKITIFEVSPQLGCEMNCDFCGCGPYRGDLTSAEIVDEIDILKAVAEKNGISVEERVQINFSDGGELLLNQDCIGILQAIKRRFPHAIIKISTVMPNKELARENLRKILCITGQDLEINWQITLYSTDQNDIKQRRRMPFAEMRAFAEIANAKHQKHRTVTISFTLKNDTHCNPEEIKETLPPTLFAIRLHPYKENNLAKEIKPMDDETCQNLEEKFTSLHYKTIRESYDSYEKQQLIHGGTNTIRSRVNQILI